MVRIQQPAAAKGSQYWLQRSVNRHPDVLDSGLRMHLRLPDGADISWVSPLAEDSYAELRDDDFLSALGVCLRKRSLDSFWPRGGPVWDGLAKTSRDDVILVEAKSHIPEMVSTCAAGPENLRRIQDSLAETAAFYGSTKPDAWCHQYYQYANRLAHLYLLRYLNEIPAWLVFVYFVNDDEMAGPQSEHEWHLAIEAVHDHLDITSARLKPYIVEVFVDVCKIPYDKSS
jgi:hypothetical protein